MTREIGLRRAAAALAASAALVASLAGQAPREERFFASTRLQFSKDEYAARRTRLMTALAASGGGVFLAPSRYSQSDGATFRQLDDFLYFTGLELPDSVLAIDADEGRALVFAPPRDPRFDSAGRRNDFPGRRLQADPAIAQAAGVEIQPIGSFAEQLGAWTSASRTLRVDPGAPGDVGSPALDFIQTWSPLQHFIAALRQRAPGARLASAYAEVARLRMVKSPAEVTAMREVTLVTTRAIADAAAHIRPGVDERSLEGWLEGAFKRGGAERLGFSSIIKSGPNSLWPWRVLAADYDRRNRRMRAGELVIFDVGAEKGYYVADVGRTFPVSGHFTPDQRDALIMETRVADAIIAGIRPGVTLADLQRLADAAIPAAERPYMQTPLYFGHHIGLSSGDPSLADAPLAPGMVVTVEPWYYNHARALSVFTEDDVLVTTGGAESLTAALPRTPDALERLVRPLAR